MRISVFFGKFLLYLTVLFIIALPGVINHFESGDTSLSAFSFLTFYLPMNLVPFIALVLATPVENNLRLKYIIGGSAIICVFTLLIIGFQFTFVSVAGELFYFYAIGRVAFPFVLWFVLMNRHMNFNF
ncbi:hypothetical protein Mzhil_0298 [Methanosalsum zhilinae DSM 4017]|uniref:Uncharacterized protein n=1 Tax=Methanosalsum zhilinae (strain DSM 4017 / NBRC 107636 / OCM 62 / WeN5) TaxID=679901 RepID=F7XNY4_METZD|nr:hypothetical protein [Methanosalsum zhilinae]AEH60174.1 hypothetical protein Mzhil_0298 [Methanosalsum zhilinae DSM 4017]